MKSNTPIVEGGGWIVRHTVGRPKARFFSFLSIAWLLVSILATVPFQGDFSHIWEPLEWLCGILIGLQAVWGVLAVGFLLFEKPRAITVRHQNPNVDLRNLY
jgi:hypothetical protein